MRFVTLRGWQLALVAAIVGLAIGAGGGLAQESTPSGGEGLVGHLPVHIHAGNCAQPDSTPSYTLTEIATDVGAVGQGPAIPVLMSATTVDATLTDLLAQPYAIDVHDLTGTVACGDLGGQPTGDTLAIGVKEVNDSGFSGIAVLQATGDQTAITLYMAHGLAGARQGETTPEASTAQVSFHIPTVTCGGCQLRVEASLHKAPGILDVAFDGQDVTVTYDPRQITPEQIQAAIEAGGDTVEPLGG
jgi:copper chaperone CopZ